MSVVRVNSAILTGLDVQRIGVEVDVRKGLPNFTVVGLAKDAMKESRDRVSAAIKNAGFAMPRMKITVNLTPVSLQKASPLLDLPIAAGILAAGSQIPQPDDGAVFLGELSLDGSLREATGVLALIDGLRDSSGVVVPFPNLADAALLGGPRKGRAPVKGLKHLSELSSPIEQLPNPPAKIRRASRVIDVSSSGDFSDVRGQHIARRAAEICAAGGHHLILIGPPGTGKSMLAQRLPTIFPPLAPSEALQVTKIYNIAGLLDETKLLTIRPFRAPHHTLSDVAMIGGGPRSLPGEISLAHAGILFLDEFPEFHRSCLESLRQPLEDRKVLISRAAAKVSYPADFVMVCAMNPCPCGYFNHPSRPCRCASAEIRRYYNKLSGPIINRIDLQVQLSSESPGLILGGTPGESSSAIAKRVLAARLRQSKRLGRPDLTNSRMASSEIRSACSLSPECSKLLESALRRMNFSPRALDKIIKVARTIADLAGEESIRPEHLMESLQFRAMDMLTSQLG